MHFPFLNRVGYMVLVTKCLGSFRLPGHFPFQQATNRLPDATVTKRLKDHALWGIQPRATNVYVRGGRPRMAHEDLRRVQAFGYKGNSR